MMVPQTYKAFPVALLVLIQQLPPCLPPRPTKCLSDSADEIIERQDCEVARTGNGRARRMEFSLRCYTQSLHLTERKTTPCIKLGQKWKKRLRAGSVQTWLSGLSNKDRKSRALPYHVLSIWTLADTHSQSHVTLKPLRTKRPTQTL